MESFFSQRAGCRVRWHDLPGAGIPMMFIHGLGCAASYDYPRVVADPAFAGRRAILVDLPGSGYSEKPREYSYAVRDQAAVVAELVAHLALPQLWLYGHSMGGSIAIDAAGLLGEKLCGLAVSEPNFRPGGGQFSKMVTRYSEEKFIAEGYADILRVVQSPWTGCLMNNAPWAVWRAAGSLVEGDDWFGRFMALNKPKMMIAGEQSLPDTDFSALATAGSATAVVPAAGHSMAWENPPGLAGVLAAFARG